MTQFIKQILFIISFTATCNFVYSQQDSIITAPLKKGSLAAYQMEVTYNKTSHLIFPSAIKYVDLGSDFLT